MFDFFKNTKNNYNYIKMIAFFMAVMFIVGPLSACDNKNKNNPKEEEPAAVKAVSYINNTNIGINEQRVSDLYANAGVTKDTFILRDPFELTLSHNNYFYTDDIYVEIKSNTNNIEIYYTLDSSTPSRDRVDTKKRNGLIIGSREYTEPIYLEATENNNPYILKFVAYSGDGESKVFTHTYFVSTVIADRFDEHTFIFSISAEPDDLYGYENGILIEGKLRDDFRKENPRHNIIPPDPANYNLRGREGEREAYVEIFKSNGQLLVSQLSGVRVHGAWSRAADRKSLRLYARKEYDPIFDMFYYPFFGEHRRNDEYGSYIYEYGTLLLRNGANDRGGSFMREEFGQALAKKAGFIDYKEFAPASVFVNGEYYGFFWLGYTYNDSYFMNMYGGDTKNLYEVVECWYEMRAGNLLDDEEFQKIEDLYDLDNMMLYYAFQIYSRNWDWPHNNRKHWRYIGEDGIYINKHYDGKYRQLLYDVEGGWGDGSSNNERTLSRVIKDSNSARVFSALMKREDMQEKFCNQMWDLLNTVFVYDIMEDEIYRITELYDYEINMAVKKRVLGSSRRGIESSRNNILKFVEKREIYIIEDMEKSFKLSGKMYYVNVKGKPSADVTLNTLKLSGAGNLSGGYFVEYSVMLKADIYPGYVFDYWEINGKKYTQAEVRLYDSLAAGSVINAELFTKPDENYKNIEIKTIRLDENHDMIVLYNPGTSETVIENLYISNDKSELQKFHIKKVRFPAKSVMTYYGKNYDDYIWSLQDENKPKIKENHVFKFKIQKGETIYLSDKNGNILQQVYIPEKFNTDRNEEISRTPDGSYMIVKVK